MTVTSGTAKLSGIAAQVFGASTIRIPKAALIDMLSRLFDAATVPSIEKLPEVRGHRLLRSWKLAAFWSGSTVTTWTSRGRGLRVNKGSFPTSAGKSEEAPNRKRRAPGARRA